MDYVYRYKVQNSNLRNTWQSPLFPAILFVKIKKNQTSFSNGNFKIRGKAIRNFFASAQTLFFISFSRKAAF